MNHYTIIKAVCLCVAVVLVFCGCVDQSASEHLRDYSVLEYGFSDTIIGAVHAIEFSYWSDGIFENPAAKSAVTVSVDGKKVRGEYDNSYKKVSDNFVTDCYHTADGNTFGVDSAGKLVYFFAAKKENMNALVTEEEALSIAKSFVEQYTDVEMYDYEITRDTIIDGYKVIFVRYMNGYQTADSATVRVGVDGQLRLFSTNMLGRFAGVSDYQFDYDRVVTAVNQKIEAIYEPVKDADFSIEHEIGDIEYTLLENNDIVLLVEVKTHIKEHVGEDIFFEHTEVAAFVVNI